MFNKNKQNDNQERKDMSGALFENANKTNKKGDNRPDLTGIVKVNGEEFWISGWMKESKSGKEYISLSFTEMDSNYQKPVKPSPSKKKAVAEEEEVDDVETEEEEEDVEEEEVAPPKRGSSKKSVK